MNQHTYEKMIAMRMSGMAKAYKDQYEQEELLQWSFDERFSLLIDTEFDYRHRNKIERLTKQAQFSDTQARLEDIKYFNDHGLNREVFLQLATNKYIQEPRNILLTGATGSGKSYIACALGNNACQSSFKVGYIRMPDLLTEFALAKVQGTYKKVLKQYQNCELLIIDEWLLIPADTIAQQDILEVLERRYRLHATIFCSQFTKEGWYERLGGGALADAIMDRALARSQSITIDGTRSMRSR